ncbi:hypothetical protein FO519_003105 [Halicephalobus sp. NKZ332]|nr:hypothetical protein FO519_003105 [Halicephalobus sp. NKZ332]
MVSQDEQICRQLRKFAVYLAKEAGFEESEVGALEDLAEIIVGRIASIVEESTELAHLAGRSSFNLLDVLNCLEFITPGYSLEDFAKFMDRYRSPSFQRPAHKDPRAHEPPQLRIGEEKVMPSYIPSFLPKFPNPHTYIKTDVTNDVEMSYRRARQLLASNKRNGENSLIRYALNIHESCCIFHEQYKKALAKTRSEIDKLEAERQAKKKRYEEDFMVDFEIPETEQSLIFKEIPEQFFVLNPLPVKDPTLLAITGDDQDEEEPKKTEDGSKQNQEDEATEELQDSKLSDTQEDELILSDSDNNE